MSRASSFRTMADLAQEAGELGPDADEVQTPRDRQVVGSVHPRHAAPVQHPEVAHERLETGREAGRGDDGVGLHRAAVGKVDTRPRDGHGRRHHGDAARPTASTIPASRIGTVPVSRNCV
jgi:hypothetical protein